MPTNTNAPSVTVSAKSGLTGLVYGGQQPIVNAKIYLYAVGTTNYGSASSSLLSVNGVDYVLSGPDGSFNITGDYNCPNANSLIYLTTVGGNAGSGPNSSAALMAALGNCNSVKANAANIFVTMNEVSTVAAVYALAPFMNSAQAVGAPSSDLSGMTNAFSEVQNLVSLGYGLPYASTPAGNGTVPAALIDTLADFIAVCVNSDGSTGSGTPCGGIFGATTVNGTVPTSTVSAALAMAKNPGLNATNIVNMVSPLSPFQPTLASVNDLSMSVVYVGGGINTPQGVAIDGQGNVWIPSANNAVTELSAATGAFLTGTTGLTPVGLDGPSSLAIDTGGLIWVSNCGNGCTASGKASSLTKITPSSGTFSYATVTDPTLNGAYSISVDSANNVWVANALGSSVAKFNNAGVVQSGSTGYTQSSLVAPSSLTPDAAGDMWVLGPGKNATVLLQSAGSAAASSYSGSAVNYPVAAAVDASGRLWVVDEASNAVSVLSSGSAISGSPFTAGGLTSPNAIALDGLGNAWVASGNGTVSPFTTAGVASTTSGLQTSTAFADGIAIDGSGSVWITSCGSYCTGMGTDPGAVVQMIGAAAPVVTPLALAAKNNQLATRP